MTELNTQKEFSNIVDSYLENVKDSKKYPHLELEARFATRNVKQVTKIDFDNVIKRLKSCGYIIQNEDHALKIQSEYIDKNSGETKKSSIRVELYGINNIEKYCNTNSLKDLNPIFTQKKLVVKNEKELYPVNVDDYNFKLSLQNEIKLNPNSPICESVKSSWNDSKKTFRLINRVSMVHNNFPFQIDLSIVKESSYEKINKYGKSRYQMKPQYTFQDANVINNSEKYEIELEVVNDKIKNSDVKTEQLEKMIRKGVIHVLSGLQNTNYPISYGEISKIGVQYLKLINGKQYHENMKLIPRSFIGPSSTTLQIKNISPINEEAVFPNIRKNYTVTDKADGMRKLLFISKEGKIYLIDTNLNIQFTGVVTKNIELFESILDGEHILNDKNGKFINLYASFDIYILNKKDVRGYPFITKEDSNEPLNKHRLPLLVDVVKKINPISVSNSTSKIRIEYKNFKAENTEQTIFQCCNTILQQSDLLEYEIDGLIFTPSYFGVGGDSKKEKGSMMKETWEYSFKWKPPEYNTIDFLVTTKKDVNGNDIVGNIFQNGISSDSYDQLSQYKTLELRVGFNERKDGYINPFEDLINDKVSSNSSDENSKMYKPAPFYPTNPSDPEAHLCKIILQNDENNNKQMMAEETNEVFENNMIVEFKYDFSKPKEFRWIPIRVRYDKTEEYRKGLPQYGNAYRVANSNWHSIHNPVTEEMISTGRNIPDELGDDDVYYNRVSKNSYTDAMRDFHNLFVKQKLIKSISKKGDTLIDYAVGKGGDIPKWIKAKLSFVFGIDISKDNIYNKLNGACARYLNYKKDFDIMPNALFLWGNSSLNIRNNDALNDEKSKKISQAVFGKGIKDKEKLGIAVYRQYGKGKEGFNISSCQFALHYFFKDKKTLNNFIRNVSECTSINGYFIGGCYNGRLIFDDLKNVEEGNSLTILNKEEKIWQVTKNYINDDFENNDSCLGYAIDVYQDSINKSFTEYLVNFDYLQRVMENYGFVPLSSEECKNIGLSQSIGSFQQLFSSMEEEIKKNPKVKNDYGKAPFMNTKEKQISFYNNYFIFKKIRNVDTESVYNIALNNNEEINELVVEE